MIRKSGPIPIIGEYRGVGLHDQQDEARLVEVRRDIDAVYAILSDVSALVDWIKLRCHSPESRLFAKAAVMAHIEAAQEKRRTLPGVDLEWLNAMTGGLDTLRGRCPIYFDGIYQPRWGPAEPNRPVKRPKPLR